MKKCLKTVIRFLKYPIMILLVYYLIASGKFDYKSLFLFGKSGNIIVVFIILFLLTFSHLLFSKRYQIFLSAMGYISSFINLFKIVMVGVFYNNFLPGGVSGDILRVYYIKKNENVPVVTGTSITLLDRVIGMLGLAVVAAFSLIFVLFFSNREIISDYRFIIILIPISGIAGLCLLRSANFLGFISSFLNKFSFTKSLILFLEVSQKLLKNNKAVIFSFLICIVMHIITILCIALIAYTLYGIDGLKASVAVSGIVLLSMAVPITPGNIGWTEWLGDSLFRIFGVDGGATVFAMWRLISILFSLLGGFFYLRMGGRKNIINTEDEINRAK